jgi:hypothetical protein
MIKHDLLILGSQNVKEADQELSRDQIYPVQILHKDKRITPVHFFNNWGDVGVSSIAWHPNVKNKLFISINDEIRLLDTKTKKFEILDLGQINDLHDINFIDGELWISNTEYDEAIKFDVKTNEVTERRSLHTFREQLDGRRENNEIIKDRFHCNQVFKDYNGDLCVLIHSITGWQYYRQVMETLIRRQGDGGVINLDKKIIHRLKLQSPHSVRKINGEYWVQDSTDQTTKIFNSKWELKDSFTTGGFGRGVDFSEKDNLAYIGISATRKRYLRVIPTGGKHSNRIMITDIFSKRELETITIPNIEQLDNVYILNDKMKSIFENLN